MDLFGRKGDTNRVCLHFREPREHVGHCGELVPHKVTASQKMLEAPAPIKKRESRIWLVKDRFDGKSNVGNVCIDHTELECADNVVVAGVHVSITARTRRF